MTAPPRVAQWLLTSTLAASDRDAVVGDLSEEFCSCIVPERGLQMARWWYRLQVARSLAPLFFRSWERASVTRASIAITLAAAIAALPAVLLVMLRTFVLQQVPLKTTAEPSLPFALALVAIVLLGSAVGGGTAIQLLKSRHRHN
jgi:hypothetical protein